MALSRLDAQGFFNNLDIDIDENALSCFKCGFPLFHDSLRYICINNHEYTYENLVYKYAEHLTNLMQSVGSNELCGIQMSK